MGAKIKGFEGNIIKANMTTNDLIYSFATHQDVPLLAEMNQQLIRDEGHRNKMTLPQLQERLLYWLAREYTAVIFSSGQDVVGYALYRQDPQWIYLRQLFVKSQARRKGIGRQAITWLKENPWKGNRIIRVEVLVGNPDGISFWKAVGFKDYSLTMEMEN